MEKLDMSDISMNVSRDAFNVAVSKIEGVISSFETVPVLKTYHLLAVGKEVKIAATDMELGVTVSVDVESMEQAGDIAIPARKLNEIIRSLPAGAMMFMSSKEGVITVRSGRTMWKIRGILGSEFPEMPSFTDDGQVWVLKRQELLVILERLSSLIASESDLRTGYKAIAVRSPHIMATDGQVLGLQKHDFVCGSVEQIPGACTKDLMAVLRLSGEDEVRMVQGQQFLFVEVGEDVFFTRLLDEWEFPEVSGFTDGLKEDEQFGSINRKELQLAVQRVKVTSSQDKQEIDMLFKGEVVRLTSSTREGDKAQEEMGCAFPWKEEISCVVSWVGLLKGLDVMQSDKIKLKVLDTCLMLKDSSIHLTYMLSRRD